MNGGEPRSAKADRRIRTSLPSNAMRILGSASLPISARATDAQARTLLSGSESASTNAGTARLPLGPSIPNAVADQQRDKGSLLFNDQMRFSTESRLKLEGRRFSKPKRTKRKQG